MAESIILNHSLRMRVPDNIVFHFRIFPGKTDDNFNKTQKITFWAHFGPIFSIFVQSRIFIKILFLAGFFLILNITVPN